MTARNTDPIERLAFGVDEAAAVIGVSKTIIWEEVKAGNLTARLRGGRTLILRDELLAYLKSLPLRVPA